MIEILIGKVEETHPTSTVILCGGVGYFLSITLSLKERLQLGKESRVPVRAIYRENEQLLFGFDTYRERELFDRLLKISGIGPKTALGIVSGMSAEELARRINSADTVALSKLPGIGKKTAERMVLELAGKLVMDTDDSGISTGSDSVAKKEAVSGLVSLGFPKASAEKAVNSAEKKLGGNAAVEVLIKEALKTSMGS